MFVPVSVHGTEVDYRSWEEFADALKDMSGPLGYIGDRLLDGVAKQFESEGGYGGRPWVQLSSAYGKWKGTRGPGLPLLVGLRPTNKVGTRANPVMGKTYAVSGKMRAELLTPSALTVGTQRMVYAPVSGIAGFHQEGTEKMPERPPVVIPLRELDEWDEIFGSWLDGLIERVEI